MLFRKQEEPMAMTKTFDELLQKNVWYDLLFRASVWVSVASVASYFVLQVDAQTANCYFRNQVNPILRLCNADGLLALFVAVAALMFKDLEHASEQYWGPRTVLGFVGGVVRRLASDLTLWTLSGLVSVLLITTVYGRMALTSSWREWAIFSVGYLTIGLLSLGIAVLNVLVRRKEPLFASESSTPFHPLLILLVYTAVLGASITGVMKHVDWTTARAPLVQQC